jgi:hypothetical protein
MMFPKSYGMRTYVISPPLLLSFSQHRPIAVQLIHMEAEQEAH